MDDARRLVEELAQADALLDARPAHAQLLALLAVIKFVESLGLPSPALARTAIGLMDAALKYAHGGAIKGLDETIPLAQAAAEVTAQVYAGSPIKDALQDVCAKYGLDEKTVRTTSAGGEFPGSLAASTSISSGTADDGSV